MTTDLIILGNQGSLGNELSSYLSPKHQVIGIDLDDVDLMDSNSLVNFLETESSLEKSRVTVINVAGLMGAKESQNNPCVYFERNGVLPYLTRKAIGRVYARQLYIHFSSETVYGLSQSSENVFNEESSCQPFHNYAISKLVGEQLLVASQDETTKTVILRVPIVIFPKQKYPNALTEMLSEIKLTKKATVFGDGKHIRNYTTSEFLLLCMDAILDKYNTVNYCGSGVELFNIPGISVSPNELLSELEKTFSFERRYVDGGSSKFSLLTTSKKFYETFATFEHRPTFQYLMKYVLGSHE